MTTLHVFKSTVPSMTYHFTNGKPAIFLNGVYRTDVESEIDELTRQIKDGSIPMLYIDQNEVTVESQMLDPMVALREKFRKEFEMEEANRRLEAVNPDNDMGTYAANTGTGLNIQNSREVADATVGNGGTDVKATLAKLRASRAELIAPDKQGVITPTTQPNIKPAGEGDASIITPVNTPPLKDKE